MVEEQGEREREGGHDVCMHGNGNDKTNTEQEADCQMHSLHPTQYPWEHEKWHKTFDHAAYVSARMARPQSS